MAGADPRFSWGIQHISTVGENGVGEKDSAGKKYRSGGALSALLDPRVYVHY